MTAGHKAGCATVLLINSVNAHLAEHEHTDLVITRLDELIEVLENGFIGRANGDCRQFATADARQYGIEPLNGTPGDKK